MKKILLMMTALLMLAAFAGCNNGKAPSSQETAPAATAAKYVDTSLQEPEWTLAEGNVQLEDKDNIYAEKKDIESFAIVTNTDGTQELRFRMNSETATMLKKQSADNQYYITLDGARIGDATLNGDCTEAVVKQENVIGNITELASKIRGLAQ